MFAEFLTKKMSLMNELQIFFSSNAIWWTPSLINPSTTYLLFPLIFLSLYSHVQCKRIISNRIDAKLPRHDCDQLLRLKSVVNHRQRLQPEPSVPDGCHHLVSMFFSLSSTTLWAQCYKTFLTVIYEFS